MLDSIGHRVYSVFPVFLVMLVKEEKRSRPEMEIQNFSFYFSIEWFPLYNQEPFMVDLMSLFIVVARVSSILFPGASFPLFFVFHRGTMDRDSHTSDREKSFYRKNFLSGKFFCLKLFCCSLILVPFILYRGYRSGTIMDSLFKRQDIKDN